MPGGPLSVLSLGLILGEGPVWDKTRRCLWFVDIKAPAIFRFDPQSRDCGRWNAPAQVGWILPASDGSLFAGLQDGIFRFDPADGSFTPQVDPEPQLPGNRLNDAAVASDGAIWFGSMDDAELAESGRIYRFHQGQCRGVGLPPASITNGPAFSPDGQTLYHTDTLARRIWASRIEGDHVVETRLFAEIEEGKGYPDGPTVDAEGCLWTGLFGGWAARHYDPSGCLIGEIRFPVANVTKIAFGGPDLATAYVTTARKGLDAAALADQPLAGNLFAFDPGVRGIVVPTVGVRNGGRVEGKT